jgi:hypothetical protein
MPWAEQQSLQFRWEVFNVTNSASFDVQSSLLSNSLGLGSGGSFGNYSGLLNNPRIMEFALSAMNSRARFQLSALKGAGKKVKAVTLVML